jgi:hypothetical protein
VSDWWPKKEDTFRFEETDNPLRADDRNFYKVEKWTKDGTKIEHLLYAGNNLEKARKLFAEAINIGRGSGSRSGSGCACCSSGPRRNRFGAKGRVTVVSKGPLLVKVAEN